MKMTENPNLEDMSSESMSLNSIAGEFLDSNTKSDVFLVDMERFSHLIEKDINVNSRITLQRNLSRKGTMRGGGAGEKKTHSITTCNERDTSILASSPRATLLHGGASMPEKAVIVAVGATDHSSNIPQSHHQITINNGNVSSTATESSKLSGKRFSFRRSPTVIIDPRRILFFFASLSCMGTILLIYLTLSMSKLNGEDHNSTLNQ